MFEMDRSVWMAGWQGGWRGRPRALASAWRMARLPPPAHPPASSNRPARLQPQVSEAAGEQAAAPAAFDTPAVETPLLRSWGAPTSPQSPRAQSRRRRSECRRNRRRGCTAPRTPRCAAAFRCCQTRGTSCRSLCSAGRQAGKGQGRGGGQDGSGQRMQAVATWAACLGEH